MLELCPYWWLLLDKELKTDRRDQGCWLENWYGKQLLVLAICKSFWGIGTEQYFKIYPLLLHLKQRPCLMCYSCLADFSWAYSKVLMSIFIAFGSLWVLYNWGAKYWGMCFRARYSILLYKPLITLVQAVTVFSSLILIKTTFSSEFRDFTSWLC